MAKAKKEKTFNDTVAEKEGKEAILNTKSVEEKRQAALDAVKGINATFGAKTVMKMNEEVNFSMPKIPTGIMSVDLALGIGGIPRGRIIELYGDASSGKTTFALHLIAETQKAGGICAFLDLENALDPSWARKLGVDMDELYVSQPSNAEESLQITEAFVKSNGFDLIVLDSAAALITKAELEGEVGDAHIAQVARLMSQFMKRIVSEIHKTKTIWLVLNQERANVGAMGNAPRKVTTSGNAIKFYSSIRAQVARTETLKKSEEPVGVCVQIKFTKNKVAPPFKQATYDLMFAGYINKEGSLLEEAVKAKVVTKSGTWMDFNDTRLGQGLDKSSEFLVANPKIKDEIEKQVLAFYQEKAQKTAAVLERRRAAQPSGETSEDQNTEDSKLQDDNE